MNLSQKKEIYDTLQKEGYPNYLASFQSWRCYAISKTPLLDVINWMDSKYGDPIRNEENPAKLKGVVMISIPKLIASYPILFAGVGLGITNSLHDELGYLPYAMQLAMFI